MTDPEILKDIVKDCEDLAKRAHNSRATTVAEILGSLLAQNLTIAKIILRHIDCAK